MTREDVVREIAQVAMADLSDPQIKPMAKLRALELIGKHLGMFGPRDFRSELDLTRRVEFYLEPPPPPGEDDSRQAIDTPSHTVD